MVEEEEDNHIHRMVVEVVVGSMVPEQCKIQLDNSSFRSGTAN